VSTILLRRHDRVREPVRSSQPAKNDNVDAVSTARALLVEPTLGPVQTLEAFGPLVAKIEAVPGRSDAGACPHAGRTPHR
jgi:hypothetical protein